MAVRKFAISISEELMKQVDRAAADRGITRSRFITNVLRRTVRARTDAQITRRLNEIFADSAVASEQRETARACQRAASTQGTEW